jgi:hypothetical protein
MVANGLPDISFSPRVMLCDFRARFVALQIDPTQGSEKQRYYQAE